MESFKLSPAIPQLPSGDIHKTADFFTEKLGFEVVAKLEAQKFLIVRRGPAEIHFWQAPTEKEAKEIGSESSCYIRVENVEALFQDLKTRGAKFRYELTKQPWGMHEMQIDDPYLNAIKFGEIIQN
ncbi:MAG: bleomycin resistance protein [Bdellovibrionota bacterium]